MRKHVIAVLALAVFTLLPIHVKAQDTDWPDLGSTEELIDEGRPRFIIEREKLELARNVSNPLSVTRCFPGSQPCVVWMHAVDFFSEWKGRVKGSTLRPDVMMHHYSHALFAGHYRSSGTYVFYLPKHKVFYLWGDCMMGHADEMAGPFAGDPRLVFKKLAEDPDSLAYLGWIFVPFQGQDGSTWPAVPSSGFDVSKLEAAQGIDNPLSLDRCRASSEKCVMNLNDFSSRRKNRSGKEIWALRPGIIAHYYPGSTQQFVFFLPKQNMFYVASINSSAWFDVHGPFVGDPRLVLKNQTR